MNLKGVLFSSSTKSPLSLLLKLCQTKTLCFLSFFMWGFPEKIKQETPQILAIKIVPKGISTNLTFTQKCDT